MVSLRVRMIATVALVLGATVVAAPAARAQTYWFESYEKVVDFVDAGRYTEASAILDGVLKQQPTPIAAVRLPGARFMDYVPYFYRARIDFSLGKGKAAAHYLDVSEAFGEPTFSRECQRDTIKLKAEIASLPAAIAAQSSHQTAAVTVAAPSADFGRPDNKKHE